MKLLIIIPAYNESAQINRVLKNLPKKIDSISKINIVVVDDGSTDETVRKIKSKKIKIIRHLINRGAGAATRTGIEYAKKTKTDIAVTFDADGQHNPQDIVKLLKPIVKDKADLAIGSRLKRPQKMPFDRFILNWIANFITLILFGVFTTDSQSGLRAFSKKAISLIDFKNDRMEFSSEILWEARRNNLRVVEIPTAAIYTVYSRQKGQKNTNAFSVFLKYLIQFLR